MADPKIKFKRSAVAGKIPTATQVPLGEIALNTYDGFLYASKSIGAGTTVIAVNPFRVGVGTNNYNTFFTAGNVGIGSTLPTSKLTVSGDTQISGVVTATTFSGSGASLTNLPAANLTGTLPSISGANLTNLNGSNISSGTVSAARVGNLPASKITTGTFDAARIPTLNQDTTGTAALAEGLTGSPTIGVSTITTTGSVGIGSTLPTGKLDVLGQVNIKGSSTTTTSGIATSYTGSVELDGTGDYLSVTDSDLALGTGDFTLEFWTYIHTQNSGYDAVFESRSSTAASDGFTIGRFGTSGHVNKFAMFVGGSYRSEADTTVANNTWSHVALVRFNGTTTLYLNGVAGSTTYSDSNNYSNTSVKIGVNASNSSDFDGNISNLRLVKGTALYTSNFTPQTAELTEVYNTVLLLGQSSSSATAEATGKTLSVTGDVTASTTNPSLVKGFDISGSVYFDGSGDYLSIPSSSDLTFGTGDFTVEMWVYAENFTNRGTFYDSRPSGGSTGITIGHDSSTGELKVYMNATSGSDQIVDSTDFAIGRWYHIAVTCESTSVRLFVNGVLKDTGTGRDLSNTNAVNIGYKTYTSSSYNYFNGFISNARIIKGTALYTSNFSPTYTELTNLPNTKLLALQSSSSATAYAVSPGAISAYGDTAASSTSPGLISPNSLTGSVAFDGNGDYLSTADNSDFDFGTGDFTIELFVNNSTSQSGNPVLIGANGGWYIQFKTGGTILEFYTGSTSITVTGLNLEGSWHHIAVTKASNSVKIFVDGVVKSTTTNSDTTNLANTLHIGNYGGSSLHYLGYISNVRVIKGTALYTAAFTPSREELTNVTNTSLLACQSSSSATAEATGKTITAVGNAAAATTSPGLVKAYTSAGGSTTTTTTTPGNLLVSGITTATNRIDIKSDDSTPGRIDFYCESSNAHYTQLRSAAHSAYSGIATVTLPTSTGTLLLTTGTAALAEGLTGSPNITVSDVNVGGISTFTDKVHLLDNDVLHFGGAAGDSGDLQIYHDTSNSYIKDAGTGTLNLLSGNTTIKNAAESKTSAVFNVASSVDLYHNNSKKLETTSTGAKITGDLVVTGEVLASTGAPIVTTTTSTSQTALDTFSHSTYTSVVYNIQATSGSDVHLTTINAIHDGSDAYITEFATLKSGSSLASYSADISGLNLRLLATPASTNSTVFTVSRTLIRASGNSDEVTTTSTAATTINEFSTSSGSSAVYIVQAKQGTNVHTTKIHLVHDGTTVSMTEFATVRTGSSLGTFDADISGSNVRLRATSASATSTTYNVNRTLL